MDGAVLAVAVRDPHMLMASRRGRPSRARARRTRAGSRRTRPVRRIPPNMVYPTIVEYGMRLGCASTGLRRRGSCRARNSRCCPNDACVRADHCFPNRHRWRCGAATKQSVAYSACATCSVCAVAIAPPALRSGHSAAGSRVRLEHADQPSTRAGPRGRSACASAYRIMSGGTLLTFEVSPDGGSLAEVSSSGGSVIRVRQVHPHGTGASSLELRGHQADVTQARPGRMGWSGLVWRIGGAGGKSRADREQSSADR